MDSINLKEIAIRMPADTNKFQTENPLKLEIEDKADGKNLIENHPLVKSKNEEKNSILKSNQEVCREYI